MNLCWKKKCASTRCHLLTLQALYQPPYSPYGVVSLCFPWKYKKRRTGSRRYQWRYSTEPDPQHFPLCLHKAIIVQPSVVHAPRERSASRAKLSHYSWLEALISNKRVRMGGSAGGGSPCSSPLFPPRASRWACFQLQTNKQETRSVTKPHCLARDVCLRLSTRDESEGHRREGQ